MRAAPAITEAAALARSDASAHAVEAAGAQPWRGAVADLAALRAVAAQADAVIHLAFGSDYRTAEAVARSIAEETAAVETLGWEPVHPSLLTDLENIQL